MMKGRTRQLECLYPPIEPYRTGYLAADVEHRVYFEESGNPRGKPVVFLHGGPGGGTEPRMRRFFNPKKYRIVLFDQRGCGRSKPHRSLLHNTAWHLVRDIEELRTRLKIERWQVFGGSWGSTLALAYAQKHPERVTELILRGIFLARRSDIDWFYQSPDGTAGLFPELWEAFAAPIPKAERRNMIRAYYSRLTSSNKKTLTRAALAWSIYEAKTSHLRPDADEIAEWSRPRQAIAEARIGCHYFFHKGFLRRDDQLLEDVSRIRSIPGFIVHGRYDVICPVRSARDLHSAWPEAELRVMDDAGHSAFEPGIARELVRATDQLS